MILTIFREDTGQIVSVISMDDTAADYAAGNIPEGCLAFDGRVDPATHYIDVSNDDQPTVFPPRPSEWHRFDFSAKEWVDPRSDQERAAELRLIRNGLLASSDWTQFPDAPLTEPQRAAWRAYRQALRDAPQTGALPEPPALTE